MKSYACAMELMQARGNTTFQTHKNQSINIIPIIVDESRSVEEAGEDLYEPLSIKEWDDYSELMKDVRDYAQYANEKDPGKQLIQKELGQTMATLIKKGSKATEENLSRMICAILSRAHERKYDPDDPQFMEHLYTTLKGISSDLFDESLIGSCGDIRAATEHLEATSTETDASAAPKRRGRPAKSAQAAPTPAPASAVETLRTTPAPAPVKPETPRELPAIMPGELPTLEIKRDCTLADIRKAFSNPDIVRRFKPVREDMPRGGKGAMDYAMAAILGGCNAVKADSPIYQINYYLYAVAANGDKDGSLGATWTWSSNCRKLLGLEKSGQIPAEYNEYFRQMPENITLQQIGEYFVDANKEAFHTFRNALIIIGINRLSEFMADLT